MKLKSFQIIDKYLFSFDFEDGTHKRTNIEELVGDKVSINELSTATIDKDWGCLEFKDGMVDIEPKTLYNFAMKDDKISA